MSRKMTLREKRQLQIIGATISLLLILWAVFSPSYGVLRYFQVKKELTALKADNQKLLKENQTLQAEIERLKREDPEYIEEVARKKFNLLKKNEVIFSFKKENAK